MAIANTPSPPYYAVIFTSERTSEDPDYLDMAVKMITLAQTQEGFLGLESARNDIGITVSYWRDLESISKWKNHLEHKIAQEKGKSKWYKTYKTRICRVERDYSYSIRLPEE